MTITKEKLAEKLHEWYLEACQKPESGMDFNPAAQEPYEALKETQKFLDRYIAGKILPYISKPRVGFLRQWLNEDRITDSNKMVENWQIEKMLGISGEEKTNGACVLGLHEKCPEVAGGYRCICPCHPTIRNSRRVEPIKDSLTTGKDCLQVEAQATVFNEKVKDLRYCEKCIQMTNHANGKCLKCSSSVQEWEEVEVGIKPYQIKQLWEDLEFDRKNNNPSTLARIYITAELKDKSFVTSLLEREREEIAARVRKLPIIGYSDTAWIRESDVLSAITNKDNK